MPVAASSPADIGDIDEGEKLMAPLRKFAASGDTIAPHLVVALTRCSTRPAVRRHPTLLEVELPEGNWETT